MFCKLNNRINTLHPKRAAVDFIQQQLAESEAPINVMTGGSVLWLTTCNRVNLTLSTEETSCYNDVPVILPDIQYRKLPNLDCIALSITFLRSLSFP